MIDQASRTLGSSTIARKSSKHVSKSRASYKGGKSAILIPAKYECSPIRLFQSTFSSPFLKLRQNRLYFAQRFKATFPVDYITQISGCDFSPSTSVYLIAIFIISAHLLMTFKLLVVTMSR
jgi:hypothetical protein